MALDLDLELEPKMPDVKRCGPHKGVIAVVFFPAFEEGSENARFLESDTFEGPTLQRNR